MLKIKRGFLKTLFIFTTNKKVGEVTDILTQDCSDSSTTVQMERRTRGKVGRDHVTRGLGRGGDPYSSRTSSDEKKRTLHKKGEREKSEEESGSRRKFTTGETL